MGDRPTPRSSIDSSQCAAVDSQLKSLKLTTHRFQSVLTLHETELKILQRLFYRNCNQHKSALFWRNVTELRRYAGRMDDMRFLDKMQSLRHAFYGSLNHNRNFKRGPWTHFPSRKCLLDTSKSVQMLKILTRKLSEVCARAYVSFRRSLQSGAFLSLLLILVAIASRLSTVASDLMEACEQADSCLSSFFIIHRDAIDRLTGEPIEVSSVQGVVMPNQPLEQAREDEVSQNLPYLESLTRASTHTAVIVERHVSSKTMGKKQFPPKKKRKPKNEIDAIFAE